LAVAKEIEKLYQDFGQWSDLSEDFYDTSEEHLASLAVDQDGKVTTATDAIHITGYSYALAAHIYLQCRVFR
jgi:hypothetical protein